MSLPYYQMYPKDFESDANVLPLTSSERGLYFWCLNRSWMDDGLPETPAKISLLLPSSMLGSFQTDWPAVEPFFPWSKDKRRRNQRQELERSKAKQKSNVNRTNGLKGGVRLATVIDLRKANGSIRASESVSVSGSESVSEKKENDAEEICALLIARHPKTGDATAAEHAFVDVLGQPNADMARIAAAHALWCAHWTEERTAPKYIPKLSNWLRDGAWRQKPPARQKTTIELAMEMMEEEA